MKVSNPQGKASLPLLAAVQSARPQQISEKPPLSILEDFCLSALVLGARFRFKPVAGKAYYLYLHEGRWNLSMVAPEEWSRDPSRHFVASCRLHPDMTWKLETATEAMKEPEVQTALLTHLTAFEESISGAGSVEAALPFYLESLPYYQRVLASGLAVSLSRSIGHLDAGEKMRLESNDELVNALLAPKRDSDQASP